MPSKQTRPRLSKGILEMKFMQRTKAKVVKEEEVEEGLAMYSKEINDDMLNSTSNFIVEHSFMNCEGLIEGRLSFRGMNPELERLLELEQMEKDATHEHHQPKEISDKDMAAAYYANKAPTATKAIQKKFQRKNDLKRKNISQENRDKYKKSKFKKPREYEDGKGI